MKSGTHGVPRPQRSKSSQVEGPNWLLIAGGALLSTLSIHLGYKLKQVVDTKQTDNASNTMKVNGKSINRKKLRCSDGYCFSQEEDGCFDYNSGSHGVLELKQQQKDQLMTDSDMALPLVTVPNPGLSKENGVLWASSPDRLELPQKPFNHSNSSGSPSVSESGSDIFSKREVIQKLRQQLKRRDDMILEMQDRIAELHNSLAAQLSHSIHLQSQVDAANGDLFDSEREIQRLRKAIADHCVRQASPDGEPSTVTMWPSKGCNGHANGYLDVENGKGDRDRIDMLKTEVGELKEVIEGKEYLLHSYKEQKAELSMKIKELEQRLDSQLPHIL